MRSTYTYLTTQEASRQLEEICAALTAAKRKLLEYRCDDDTPAIRVARENQLAKIARLTQRRVTAEEHLRRAQRMEGRG